MTSQIYIYQIWILSMSWLNINKWNCPRAPWRVSRRRRIQNRSPENDRRSSRARRIAAGSHPLGPFVSQAFCRKTRSGSPPALAFSTRRDGGLPLLELVQAETTLKLRQTRHKLGGLRRLRLKQLDQFFTRRNIRQHSDHPILEPETTSNVQKKSQK